MTRIAVVQSEPKLGEVDANYAGIESSLRQAAAGGAKLVVFTEAAVTGYCFDSLAQALPHAECVPGRTADRLAPICRELNVHAVVGTLERQGGELYNVVVLVGPEGFVGAYRKTHLPRIGVDRYATPGQGPFRLYDIAGLRVGMLICYDGGFPEPVRVHALNGADVVVLPTNWPDGAQMVAQHVGVARALENAIYFAAAGRVGQENGTRFIGGSSIIDPAGRTLAAAHHDRTDILYADVDVNLSRHKAQRNNAVNRVGDRRPELYKRLLE
jgi:predicted amidohydrolase